MGPKTKKDKTKQYENKKSIISTRKGRSTMKLRMSDDVEDIVISMLSLLESENTSMGVSPEIMINKLIRDDRYACKLQRQEREKQRQLAYQLKHSVASPEPARYEVDVEAVRHPVEDAVVDRSSSTLRIECICTNITKSDRNPSSTVLVVNRETATFESVVKSIRNKFKLSKDYTVLFDVEGGFMIDCDEGFNSLMGRVRINCLLDIRKSHHLETHVSSPLMLGTEMGCVTVDQNNLELCSPALVIDPKSRFEVESTSAMGDNDTEGSDDDSTTNAGIANSSGLGGSISLPLRKSLVELDLLREPNYLVPDHKWMKEDVNFALLEANTVRMHRESSDLPVASRRQDILKLIADNPVVVISGETGSGKTTQVPSYILDDMVDSGRGSESMIICTQPRRIAAVTVAERVAWERNEQVGQSVGYEIRLESRRSDNTRLLYCTTGILLQRIRDDRILSRISHIIVDEVHERQVEVDFLITILKLKSTAFPRLKLILMSATLDNSCFSTYFHCPSIHISGRTFPVAIHYIDEVNKLVRRAQLLIPSRDKGSSNDSSSPHTEGRLHWSRKADQKLQSMLSAEERSPHKEIDKEQCAQEAFRPSRFDADLVAEAVIRIIQTFSPARHIPTDFDENRGDAILVFLSGLQSIEKVSRALRARNLETLSAQVFVLHSSVQANQQRAVFNRTRPRNWKIILATNIAETSITIDDVTHVIDTGYHKEIEFDVTTNLTTLKETFISRASAKQRSGRAGRVRPGHCWRLYSEEFFMSRSVADFGLPEIQRVALTEVVLQVMLLDVGQPITFLSACPEPPSNSLVLASIRKLIEIQALERPEIGSENVSLTALGYHLARLPVDVHIGKMMIMGLLLDCVDDIVTIAACLCGKSPFLSPQNKSEEAYKTHCQFTARQVYCREQKQADTDENHIEDCAVDANSDEQDCASEQLPVGNDVFNVNRKVDIASHPTSRVLFSDHLAMLRAYNRWIEIFQTSGCAAAKLFCKKSYLSYAALMEIKNLRELLRRQLYQGMNHDRSTSMFRSTTAQGSMPVTDSTRNMASDRSDVDTIFSVVAYDTLDEIVEDIKQTEPEICSSLTKVDIAPETSAVKTVSVADHDGLASIDSKFNLIRCCLCQGLIPNIAVVRRMEPQIRNRDHGRKAKVTQGRIAILLADGKEVFIHPSSLTHRHFTVLLEEQEHQDRREAYIVYHRCVESTRIFLHDCSAVPPLAVLLFGGEVSLNRSRDTLQIGSFIHMRMNELHAVLCKRIHQEFEILLQLRLNHETGEMVHRRQSILRNVLEQLLHSDGLKY